MNLTRPLLFLFALTVWASAAAAGDLQWRIVQSTGVVKAGASGFMPAAVSADQTLPKDSWVETGDTGRVVLVRGQESIAVGPNSRLQLPSGEINGNTQVLQTLGAALYQIGKQKAPHFQVDTPYLAAVVKGTTFTVSVGEAVSSVEVSEGLVEVASADGGDVEHVSPGFTGIVTKHDLGNVVVLATERAPDVPDAAPRKDDNKGDRAVENKGEERVMIANAIGEVSLDVKEASGGLATGEAATTTALTRDSATTVVDAKTDTTTDAVASTEPASVDTPAGDRGLGKALGVDNGMKNDTSASTAASVDAGLSISTDVARGGNASTGVGFDATTGIADTSVGINLGTTTSVSVDVTTGGTNGNGNANGAGNGLGLGLGNNDRAGLGSNGNGGGLGAVVGATVGRGRNGS